MKIKVIEKVVSDLFETSYGTNPTVTKRDVGEYISTIVPRTGDFIYFPDGKYYEVGNVIHNIEQLQSSSNCQTNIILEVKPFDGMYTIDDGISVEDVYIPLVTEIDESK